MHSSIIDSSPKVEATKCPSMDEWMNKMWYRFTTGILFSLKREGNSDTSYNMVEPIEKSQSQKDKYCMIPFI